MAGRLSQPHSRYSSPDDTFNADPVFDLSAASVPRIQLVKPSYPHGPLEDSLFTFGALNAGQTLAPPNLAMHLQYIQPQMVLLAQMKEDSVELEDYVQGLNNRFDMPNEDILPMTPRCSFDGLSLSVPC
jgi:hypothetical protein